MPGPTCVADPAPLLRQIEDLLVAVSVLDFDPDCARRFGQLRGEMRRLGVGVGPMDLLIASVALAHNLTLVTHNTAHFASIPGLRLDDWLAPGTGPCPTEQRPPFLAADRLEALE